MQKKAERLDVIRRILSENEVCSQVELLTLLKKEGLNPTQATLSRDLRLLRVAKTTGNDGKYIYILPEHTGYRKIQEATNFTKGNKGFISIRFSQNMAVIRTRPGYASSLASDIDNLNLQEIMGTIAGDDTILLITEEKISQQQVCLALSELIPEIIR